MTDTTAVEQELKPCPFCGGEAELLNEKSARRKRGWYPTCAGDNSECPGVTLEQDEQGGTHFGHWTRAEAITAWNTRQSAPDSALVEALLMAVRFVDDACGEGIDIGDNASITIYEHLTNAFADAEYIEWDQEVLVRMIRETLTTPTTQAEPVSDDLAEINALKDALAQAQAEIAALSRPDGWNSDMDAAPREGTQIDILMKAGRRIPDCAWSELDLAYSSPWVNEFVFPDDAKAWLIPPTPSEGG